MPEEARRRRDRSGKRRPELEEMGSIPSIQVFPANATRGGSSSRRGGAAGMLGLARGEVWRRRLTTAAGEKLQQQAGGRGEGAGKIRGPEDAKDHRGSGKGPGAGRRQPAGAPPAWILPAKNFSCVFSCVEKTKELFVRN